MTSPPSLSDSTVDAAGRVLAEWARRLYFWRAFVLSDATYDGTGELVFHDAGALR